MSPRSEEVIVIATGGTGGHVFPAQALGSTLKSSHKVVFLGGGLGTNRYFQREGCNFHEVSASRVYVVEPFGSLLKIVRGIAQAWKLMRKMRPSLVVGFGSFYTFPVLVAAKLRNIPLVLFEPNLVLGKVNKLFSKGAAAIAVQFSEPYRELGTAVVEVKMPSSSEEDLGVDQRSAREYFYLSPARETILVLGGSQGSHFINWVFSEAVRNLHRADPFQVIHIAGSTGEADTLRYLYEKAGIACCVKSFEPRMDLAWKAATIGVSRAGAGAVAKLIEHQVPTILIPFPRAAGDHQTKNGEFVERVVGGGVVCPERTLTAEGLLRLLKQFLDRDYLQRAQNSFTLFRKERKPQEFELLVKTLAQQSRRS